MKLCRPALLVIALCATGLGASALQDRTAPVHAAQSGARAAPRAGERAQDPSSDESTPTLESARARWERLSPEEQARLRKNYEHYRSLTEEERRGLAERARRLREERERMRAELTPEAREKLQQLDPDKRREVMRDLLEGEVRERGARIREKMPDAWIERLEQARPEDRARFLAEFQRKARERVTLAALDNIGRRLALSPEEIERLKSLPSDERAAGLLELKKRLSSREAETLGLPAGITQAQWDEWQTLPPAEFFEVMQRYRHEREGGKRHAVGPAAKRAVEEALRPRPEDVLDMAELAPAERRLRMFQMRRDRVVRVVREHGLLPPERIGQLERLPEGAFLRVLRDVVLRPLGARGERSGDGEPRRERE